MRCLNLRDGQTNNAIKAQKAPSKGELLLFPHSHPQLFSQLVRREWRKGRKPQNSAVAKRHKISCDCSISALKMNPVHQICSTFTVTNANKGPISTPTVFHHYEHRQRSFSFRWEIACWMRNARVSPRAVAVAILRASIWFAVTLYPWTETAVSFASQIQNVRGTHEGDYIVNSF